MCSPNTKQTNKSTLHMLQRGAGWSRRLPDPRPSPSTRRQSFGPEQVSRGTREWPGGCCRGQSCAMGRGVAVSAAASTLTGAVPSPPHTPASFRKAAAAWPTALRGRGACGSTWRGVHRQGALAFVLVIAMTVEKILTRESRGGMKQCHGDARLPCPTQTRPRET